MKIKKTFRTSSISFKLSSITIPLLLIVMSLPSCTKEKPQPPKSAAVPVTAGTVVQKNMPLQVRAIGNVEAYSTVQIKARAAGELIRVNFREGQDVNKGDLLFALDPRPYETALEAARANLQKDTALAKKAEDDVLRYTELFKENLVSRNDYERALTTADAARATVAADKAAVEFAKLQLGYCSIHAPVSGRTGGLLADAGNLIKADNNEPLVVINQIQPVYVSFSVPEQSLPEIKKYMASGKLGVEAIISDADSVPAEGVLTFIDNAVDTTTGTIKLKATFPNKDKRLWPGQFVNVVMTLTTQPDALVAPSQAILSGQQGQYLFVIRDDNTVESRPVAVDRISNSETVLTGGVKPGEKVVTDGQLRLVSGAKVEIKEKRIKD